MNLPPVTLVVLNWNGRAYLEACLSSLLASDYPQFEIILVDNASTDDSVSYVRGRFPDVEVLELAENLGFSAGNNAALRQLDTDIAVLVNPDVVVESNWLRELVRPLIADETIGITGSLLFYPDGSQQHAGGKITSPRASPQYLDFDVNHASTALRDVDYVIGASLAIHRRAIEAAGLMDEGYFLYFEDSDWCKRVRRAGLRVAFVPTSRAVHHESAVAEKMSQSYFKNMHAGRWRYLLKHEAADVLTEQTFSAERAWLQSLPRLYRPPLALAYRHILKTLPNIWQAREKDGGSKLTQSEKKTLQENLHELQKAASQTAALMADGTLLDELEENWQLREFEFQSNTPFVGPLVTALRRGWHAIASKWAVRHVIYQQNYVNRLIRLGLNDYANWLVAQDRDQVALTHRVSELSAQLVQTQQQVQRLEDRLRQLEELSKA